MANNRIINLLMIIALLLMSGSVILAYRHVRQLEKSYSWVNHSQSVINQSNKTLLAITQAELLVQDYLQKENNTIPLLFRMKLAELQSAVNEVDRQTKDDPTQQQNIAKLHDLLTAKIALLQRGLTDPQLSLPTVSRGPFNDSLRDLSGKISELISNIQENEMVTEGIWGAEYRRDAHTTYLTLVITAILGNLFLLLSFITLNYQLWQRKIAERAKEKLQSNFERIINSSHDLIASIDTDYIFTALNNAYRNQFEALFGKFITPGMSLQEVFNITGEIESLVTVWKRALNGETFTVVHQFDISTSEGQQTKFYEATYSPIYDSKDQLLGACHIMRDVTERRKIEEIKNEFIVTVSNELRTPLTSIRSSLGLILDGALGQLDEKTKNKLTIAHHNCERLIQLINDILDVEKIETGELEFHFQTINLNHLLEETVSTEQPNAAKAKVNLIYHQTNAIALLVRADRERLKQVVETLIRNAIKFSRAEGKITVMLEKHADRARVCVIDDGFGIPIEFQEHIFGKISHTDFHAHKSTDSALSLNISKAIIDRHEGSIQFSTKQNEGSVFYFDLPILKSEQLTNDLEEIEISTLKNETGTSLPTILHVEDDADLSTIIATVLHDKASVVTVQNKQKALRYLGTNKIDLVLLDLMLPDSSGLELLPEINRLNIPIIVFSSYDLPAEYQEQVDFNLLKSKTTNQQLIETVEAALKLRK